MSHSGGAMKLMMVMMAMALLTTSHGIGIHINTSVVTGGYSASRCNGLTDTACRIAHSELDFDLEFMLDSEFSIRLLADGGSHHTTSGAKQRDKAVSCGRADEPPCHGNRNQNGRPEHCNDPHSQFNRVCASYNFG
ncbi:unnamed protein product [Prunus armeniaca]|uniref:Uncharacterized protein n=1 Tax=Prunus armeniaca TaxID=36596 RepID=A0A6J5XFR8_PRUAR|nr:hypothetical protein GBA52_016117 [Prunus armeniaca]CAB4309758.1 unnamed protein product [Prunus armeniaca]